MVASGESRAEPWQEGRVIGVGDPTSLRLSTLRPASGRTSKPGFPPATSTFNDDHGHRPGWRRKGESMQDGRTRRGISRRDFLRIGGAGIAGAALTGVAGCGGGGQAGGAKEIVFSSSIDDTGTAKKLVDRFNRQNRSGVKVEFRRSEEHTSELQSRQYLVC